MRTSLFLIAMMITLDAPAAMAESENISCPDTVNVASQQLTKRPEGWRYFTEEKPSYALDKVLIYSGKKHLSPVEVYKGTESYTQWLLPDNGTEKYFAVCTYTNTAILLKRELPTSLKRCTLSFEPESKDSKEPQALHKLTCE